MINYFGRGIPVGMMDINGKGIKNGDLVLYVPTKEKYIIQYDDSRACFAAVKDSVKHPLYTLSPNTNIKILESFTHKSFVVRNYCNHIG